MRKQGGIILLIRITISKRGLTVLDDKYHTQRDVYIQLKKSIWKIRITVNVRYVTSLALTLIMLNVILHGANKKAAHFT